MPPQQQELQHRNYLCLYLSALRAEVKRTGSWDLASTNLQPAWLGREPHQDDEPDAVPRAPAGRSEPEDALGGEGAPLLLLRLGVEVQHPRAEHGLLRTGDTYVHLAHAGD